VPARRNDFALPANAQPVLADVAALRERFLESMDDDFNTGGAIGDLFELVRRLNKLIDEEKLEEAGNPTSPQVAALRQGAAVLRELAGVLGLFRTPPAGQAAGDDQLTGKLIELLIQVRADARKTKNFAAADKIRNRLAEIGVKLEDRPTGTEWSREG
jgi:cysteinyl-tRNA synthetase